MQDFCRFIGMDIVIPDAPEITDDERQQANETKSTMLVDLLPYVEEMFGLDYRTDIENLYGLKFREGTKNGGNDAMDSFKVSK